MGRVLVPVAFGMVALMTGRGAFASTLHAAAHPSWHNALVATYHLLRTAVVVAFCAFTVGRSQPHRRARQPLAILSCGAAILAVLALAPPRAHTNTALVLAGDTVAVIACLWLLYALLALRRCFGVLPEARGLVTGGAYRYVRHPVYLGELAATLGLALAAPGLRNGLVLGALLAAQLTRMRLEERALTLAFPQYEAYAAATPRLVPRPGPARGRLLVVPTPASAE